MNVDNSKKTASAVIAWAVSFYTLYIRGRVTIFLSRISDLSASNTKNIHLYHFDKRCA